MFPSQNPYNPNAFNSFWKPFIRVFQAFSMSHYSIFRSEHHPGYLVYFIVFSLFNVIINTYSLNLIYLLDKSLYERSHIMYYVSYVTILNHTIVSYIYHFEAFFSLKKQQKIIQKLSEINEVFATKLNYNTDFGAIRKKFIRHTATCLVCISMFFIGGAIHSPPADGSTYTFVLMRIVALSANIMRRFQIAIHINSITNILTELKILLEKQQNAYRPSSKKVIRSSQYETLQHIRAVYSNAWVISKLIDGCFGWTLVMFLIEIFADLINSTYQYYLNISVYKSTHNTIRKYFIFYQYFPSLHKLMKLIEEI